MNRKNVIIILVTLIMVIFAGILMLKFVRKIKKDRISDAISYIQDNKEQDNEANNPLDDERIVVVLPNEENNINNEIDKNEEKPETPPTNNQVNNNNSDKKYYIKVNNQANVVTIYKKDSKGKYTVPVKAMICSTGKATPKSGTYQIQWRWEWLGLVGNVYGHYSTQIVGDILFHSVPYLRKGDPGSLEYWEYDKLGTSCSAGCVRLTTEDAKWIFNNVEKGTIVEFYYSSNPGPLRKTKC